MVCVSGFIHPIKARLLTTTLGLIGYFLSSISYGSDVSSTAGSEFQPGWGGFIQLAVLISESQSLSAVSDGNERLSSLSQNAKSDTEGTLTPLGEVNYTLDNRQTQFYAGTPQDGLMEGNPIFELGLRHELQGGTLLTAALLPKVPGFDEVWEDPYLTGSKRERGDSTMVGGYVSAEYLYGGPISLRYAYATLDVEDEASGQSLLNQPGGLTSEDIRQLRRDADFHQAELSLTLPFSHALYVIPAIRYTLADADGEAFSFDRYSGELFIVETVDSLELNAGVSYDVSEYEESHPVFDKTREDDQFSAVVGLGWLEPFDWQQIRLDVLLSYSKRDSNIHFYDQEDTMGLVGVAYSF
ncbi:DUF2860 family protein [Litoribrevibacter euphylliae]|uniref:DUF2860 family protein n=1 Tax=Litoribrevibacter euphylliae TaxID=1834034 RepID=A0ABV7HKB9_9GAMM